MKIIDIVILIPILIILSVVSLWMGNQSYHWFPPQASAESLLVDDLFSFLVTLGSFIFLGVTGAILYSMIFYRAGKYDMSDGPAIEGNATLEIVWTAIPLFLVVWITSYSYQVYSQMSIHGPMDILHLHTPIEIESANAAPVEEIVQPTEKIEVISKQWAWIFRYPEQNITSSELHLPVNRRVSLKLQSEDVIHGLYIPAFRLKQDIIPNQTMDFEFTPIRVGKYRLRDSQYSGTYFAAMQSYAVVESVEDYNQWLKLAATQTPTAAPNQAVKEYTRHTDRAIETRWPIVAPAKPPLVNFHD
jgi:cytochrome c oxidase subunit 2